MSADYISHQSAKIILFKCFMVPFIVTFRPMLSIVTFFIILRVGLPFGSFSVRIAVYVRRSFFATVRIRLVKFNAVPIDLTKCHNY